MAMPDIQRVPLYQGLRRVCQVWTFWSIVVSLSCYGSHYELTNGRRTLSPGVTLCNKRFQQLLRGLLVLALCFDALPFPTSQFGPTMAAKYKPSWRNVVNSHRCGEKLQTVIHKTLPVKSHFIPPSHICNGCFSTSLNVVSHNGPPRPAMHVHPKTNHQTSLASPHAQ